MIEEPWVSLIFIAAGGLAIVAVALGHDWLIARAALRRLREHHSAE